MNKNRRRKRDFLIKHPIVVLQVLLLLVFSLFNLPGKTFARNILKDENSSIRNFDLKPFDFQDEIVIEGIVTDAQETPLGAVNVTVKGSSKGVATNIDGEYKITADQNDILVFNSIGFESTEIEVNNQTEINIALQEKPEEIGEITISTGFNRIKREHIASSVASVDMGATRTRPIKKLQQAFTTIPGVTVRQRNNLPGEAPSLRVRGDGTLGGKSPLVIVDGMEMTMNDLDPNQIRSIDVLKDAAATSMYGSKGANGVVIIETNRADAEEFQVDINTWIGFDNPIDKPDFVNAVDYMKLRNEARELQGQDPSFTQEEIRKTENGELPNTDWYNAVQQKQANSLNSSANIKGGGSMGTFSLMLNYMNENGLNSKEGSDKYSARFNTNINIAKDLDIKADFYAQRLEIDRLHMNSDGNGLYKQTWRLNPTQEPYFEDTDEEDHLRYLDNRNPIARIEKGGQRTNLHDKTSINLRPNYNITEGLSIGGDISYVLNKSSNKHVRRTYKFTDRDGKPVDQYTNAVGSSQGVSTSNLILRGLLKYNSKIFNDRDHINFLAAAEARNHLYSDYREEAQSSFFSKLNYAFDNRYLLEANIRADGSSKFAPGHQWGYFPSISAGWNLHNESFMKPLTDSGIINNLKFRFSYGKIGNENVAPYLWEEIVNDWGWVMRVPNPEFTWEKQNQYNFGVDLNALGNRLNVTFDMYKKHSYDLIYDQFPVPPLTGANSLESSVNIGEVDNKGWEITAKWTDQIGADFTYSIQGSLYDNKNAVVKAGHSANDSLSFKGNSDKIWYKGIPMNNFYGFETDGYYQNDEEVANADAKFPNTQKGDIKYIDQNKDGNMNDKDRVFLGDMDPHFNYYFSLELAYKNWDFLAIGRGVGKKLGKLNGLEGQPVIMGVSNNDLGTPRKYYRDNRWTPDNPDSRFPRVWTGDSSNDQLSDLWLSDMSFFRIQTLQLGYTFPKVGNFIENLRLYANAEDAFTFTSWEGLDPERQGGSGDYPRMATFSIGASFTLY